MGHDARWQDSHPHRRQPLDLRPPSRAISYTRCAVVTALADDPLLNVRLDEDPEARQPIRIVCDRQARLPLDSQLVQSAHEQPLIVAHAPEADPTRLTALQEAGAICWSVSSMRELMERAGREKIDSILVEGGGTILEALFADHLIDEVTAFIAPKVIGGATAKTPIEGAGIDLMRDALLLHPTQVQQLGPDIAVTALTK